MLTWFGRIGNQLGFVLTWHTLMEQRRPPHRCFVPVIQQMAAVECGAACLAMILSYHGRETSVAECRKLCTAGRDGLTAQTVAEAARRSGLHARGFSIEPVDLQHLQLPAIVHWNFNHFVVVEHWTPQQVRIVDPALGRRWLSAEEFAAAFTGVVLTFEPGPQFERRRATRQPWFTYLKPLLSMPGVRGLLVQIIGASFLLQTLGLVSPIFTKVLVDQILPQHTSSALVALGAGTLFMLLAHMVTTYLRATLLLYLRARLDAQMMIKFFEHVLTLPFRFFQERTSGDLLMRLNSNVMIRETLTGQIVSTILDGSLVLAYLFILLAYDLLLGLLVLAIGTLQVALLLATARLAHDLMQRELSAQADAQGYMVEALRGIVTLKVGGAENRALAHWSNLFYKHLNITLQRSHLAAILDTANPTLRALAPLLLLWVGALRVLEGDMSLGTLLALNALALAFLTPLASLVSQRQAMIVVRAHLDRVADVLEAEAEQDRQQLPPTPPLAGRIELKQVSFRYDPSAPWVLRDISLTIQPGQKVAIVGKTGSGKSTLAMLLVALYQPTEGDILYDGLPLHCLDYRTLRQQFGVVLQEPFLFSGSIRQNISLNAPAVSLEQVVKAAQLAAMHEEIIQMPMGYETFVTEGGAVLSGGQRQRLSLARALVHHPAILLLDEATSHLDLVTEALVDRNLGGLSCTRIVIAHRLSTILNADQIVVLDQGRIIEQGTHEELLARGRVYTELIRNQIETVEAVPIFGPPPRFVAGQSNRKGEQS